jgi:hypothetical protein
MVAHARDDSCICTRAGRRAPIRGEQLMDPDATLARIRELVIDVQAHSTSEPALDLAGQIEALDNWMSRNGFAPVAWRPK